MYQFLTTWQIRAPRERIWDVLRDTPRWPEWWIGVLAVERLQEGDSDGVGQIDRYRWKSRLPYELAFEMRTTRVVRPEIVEGTAEGELKGRGLWELTEQDGVTTVRYHWQVAATKPWMNLLEPLLRPLFVWNHDWVMSSGGRGLARRLGVELVASTSGEERPE